MHRLLLTIGLGSGVFLACSGSDGGTGSANVDVACDDAATAYCDAIRSCSTFFVNANFTDAAQCRARAKLDCVARLNASGSNFTTSDLSTCVSDVRKKTGCSVLDEPVESCKRKPGLLKDGTPCGVDDQCENRNCRLATGSTCGACSTRSAGGGSCQETDDCEEGLACANSVCVVRGKQGDACSAAKPCLPSLACNASTCSVPLTAGTACTPKRAADPDDLEPCDRLNGTFCHGTTRVCTAITLAGPGQPCGIVGGTIVGCSGGGNCKLSANFMGTCQAPALDGQPCDDTNGPKCISPARCKGGVCTLIDPNACK